MEEREYIEARVYLADWQIEKFLDFCEQELGQLPELSRAPEGLNGYKKLFELLAAKEDERLTAPVSEASKN